MNTNRALKQWLDGRVNGKGPDDPLEKYLTMMEGTKSISRGCAKMLRTCLQAASDGNPLTVSAACAAVGCTEQDLERYQTEAKLLRIINRDLVVADEPATI